MKKVLLALLATVSTVSIVHAEGAYVGVGAIGSRYNYNIPGATGTDNNSGNKLSGKVFGGYELNKTWSLEGGYADLGSSGYSYTDPAGTAGHLDSYSHSFYGAAKATFPINEKFDMFGKLGAARNHLSVAGTGAASALSESTNKTELYAAVGGQYNLSKNVGLTLEYERYGKDRDLGNKMSGVTAGVRYGF